MKLPEFPAKNAFRIRGWKCHESGKLLEPIHPGEILLEEFMKPMGISINGLAREIAVPPGRISAIVKANAQ